MTGAATRGRRGRLAFRLRRRLRFRLPAPAPVAAAVLVVTLTGCGIPSDDRVRTRDPEDVPFGLLRPDATTTTTAPTAAVEAVTVYFAGPDRLIPVARELRVPVTIAELVRAVTRGPTAEEAAAGLRSALTSPDSVRGTAVAGGVATVDLGPSFRDVPPSDQVMGLAQLVYTLTGRPGIGRVAFTLDGQPVDIPRGDGSLTSGSVARDEYASLAPA